MNITFMIGNGFDLACGLNTKFVDVYDEYCISPSKNENIKEFKEEILGKDKNYENWTDFEMALPRFGKKINDFDKFAECVIDFTDYLNDYLIKQQNRIDVETEKAKITNRMNRYIYEFYNYMLINSKKTLDLRVNDRTDHCAINFITFNYTNTLEKLLSTVSHKKPKNQQYAITIETPLHIHGTLDNGILLGLDDEDLYKDIPCNDIRKLKNFIDKIHINHRQNNLTSQATTKLEHSSLIAILGWSMGDSDSFWVNSIKDVLAKNKKSEILFVPYYSEIVDKKHNFMQLDREDECKDYIAKVFDIPNEEIYRIHIITDSDYMNLKFIAKDIIEDDTEKSA